MERIAYFHTQTYKKLEMDNNDHLYIYFTMLLIWIQIYISDRINMVTENITNRKTEDVDSSDAVQYTTDGFRYYGG